MGAPPEVFVAHAINAAQKSTCQKSQRGAVIFKPAALISTGFNSPVSGYCAGTPSCRRHCRRRCVHAEQAALLRAGRRAQWAHLLHVKVKDGELAVSGPPSCVECAKLIHAAGISIVWLYRESGWKAYPADEFHRLSWANE